MALEQEFCMGNKYITPSRRTAWTNELNLSERQIKIWFQNRRAKERRIIKRLKEGPLRMYPAIHTSVQHIMELEKPSVTPVPMLPYRNPSCSPQVPE